MNTLITRDHAGTIVPYKDTKVCIDNKILKTILTLWALGKDTEFSCEGDEKYSAYILFKEIKDAIWFFLFLRRMGIDNNVTLGFRQVRYGGGASVHFCPSFLPNIEKVISYEVE